jgi:hypothetical protein
VDGSVALQGGTSPPQGQNVPLGLSAFSIFLAAWARPPSLSDAIALHIQCAGCQFDGSHAHALADG